MVAMRIAKLFIEIDPKGKQLPFSFNGRRIKDSRTRAFEAQLKSAMKIQFQQEPFDTAISIKVRFGIERPASVKPQKRPLPSVKPDLDNLIKSLDSGTGILWKDDNLICKIQAEKVYSDKGFIELTVAEICD